jgi:class 3 adenylate cyclase/tetratricopeptide (TPR) repeat protein
VGFFILAGIIKKEMTKDKIKRKLTAILSADVKGYSRLMGEDEEGTLRTLNACKEVMRGLIEQYRGRTVGTAGDNILADFASVVDAVQCAVEIQQLLKSRNAVLPETRRMEFRIGINLGDVIEEEDSIYGNGVNIAARLEGLTEGGGICVSSAVFDQVKKKVAINFQFLGEKSVKNISEPLQVYKVLLEGDSPAASAEEISSEKKGSTGEIISEVTIKTTGVEKRSLPETFPEIRQHLLRYTPEAFAAAFSLLKEELKNRPPAASIHPLAAYILWEAANQGWLQNLGIGYFESRLRARLFLKAGQGEASPWENIIRSEIRLLRRDFSGAVKLARETLEMSPGNPLLLSWLAQVLIMAGRPMEAIPYGQEAVRNDPDHPSLHLARLGLAYLSMGQIPEAIALYDKAEKKNTLINSLKAAQVVALYYSDKPAECRDLLDQYKKIWPVLPNIRRIMFFWPFQDDRTAHLFAEGLIGAKFAGKVSDCLNCLKDQKLNGNVIRSTFFGKTLTGFDPWTGQQEWVRRDIDGKAFIYGGPNGKIVLDKGYSRVDKDNLCDCWEERTAGIEIGSPVFQNIRKDPWQKEEYILFTDYGFFPMSTVEVLRGAIKDSGG